MSIRQRLRKFLCKIGIHDWSDWGFSHNNMPDEPKHWAKVYTRRCCGCKKFDMEYRPLSVSEVFDPNKGVKR